MRSATGSSATASASSMVNTGWKVISSRTFSGTSSRSPALRRRDDDVGEAGAVGGQHLLLDAADRQHAALQRDLAGHADVVADGSPA